MPLYTLTKQVATGQTTAQVVLENVPTGRQWVVSQISVETIPPRNTAQATVKLNGRYITSTVLGKGSSAQGPPFLTLTSNDDLTIDWSGMTAGDNCIGNFIYNESQAGTIPVGMGWLG